MSFPDELRQSMERRLRSYACLSDMATRIATASADLITCLAMGGRVFTCGNGGSAAEALHLAEEMIGRFARKRKALAAICLSADPTALTCIANDFGYEHVFSRQLEGLARSGDLLIALSTSGKSPNINRALQMAKDLGMKRIGLLGPPGSPAESLCNTALTFNEAPPAHVQEMHLILIHTFLEQLDAASWS